jgi:Flp pilus assembly protein TadD
MLLLSPSLLIPNSDSFNEGRIYLALAGFALMFGSVLATISSRLPHLRGRLGPLMQKVGGSVELGKGIPVVAVLIVVSALALPTTLWRNQIWNEDVCIWEEAALRNAGDYRTHYNLGVALARKGSLEDARWRFGRSKDLNPDDDMSYAGLGFCAESEELWPEALEFYGTAVKLNPNNNYAVSAVRRVESVIEKEVD